MSVDDAFSRLPPEALATEPEGWRLVLLHQTTPRERFIVRAESGLFEWTGERWELMPNIDNWTYDHEGGAER